MIPSSSSNRAVNRRARQNKRSGRGRTENSANDKLIASSHSGVQVLSRVRNEQDYINSSFSTLINKNMKPPKDITHKVHWFQFQVMRAQGQSISTTAPTELNYSFAITDEGDIGPNIQGLFDQYCIYAVVVNVCVSQVSSTSNSLGRVTTAIDYDNAATLGSETLIQSFSTAQTVEVVSGLGIQRFIKPCVDPLVYPTNNGVGRLWVDSNSTPSHFSIRSFWAGNTSSNMLVDFICTYIVCGRNNI